MTGVPMNDLQRTYALHARSLEQAASDVLRSGRWINGAQSQAFCKAFADSVGVAHCVGVGNGTDALEIAVRAVLAGSSIAPTAREVVVTANAGGYAATACFLAGCTPVFADVEANSLLQSTPSTVAALTDRTAAVIATHLYGGLVDVPALRSAMDTAGYAHVPILEDCAQAHGLEGSPGKAGALALAATYSFYPTKNLGAFGDSGAIVTGDALFAESVRRLHQYGWVDRYRIGMPAGRNSRLDEIQAAFLLTLLPHLSAANTRRREILDAYEKVVGENITLVRSPHGTVAHLAVILVEDRAALRDHLSARGIATDVHYPVLDCDQEGWRDQSFRIGPDGLDVSRWSVSRILSIPCFPTMTDEEVAAVCSALASYSPS
jgi:dTDP-4-amino-4,6-dideoxygalactose transaminase